MSVSDELLDQLLAAKTSPEDILGENGLLKALTRRVAERAPEGEPAHHPGYTKHDPAGNHTGNSRNGKSHKTVRSVHSEVALAISRDRNGPSDPKLVKRGERQFNDFDEQIVSLYARGVTTRDIQACFREIYGVDVSASFIFQVTDAVMDAMKVWQSRPLESVDPIVSLDALVVRSRPSGAVQNLSVCLALGLNREGEKELLGLWIARTEGAKFWLSVMTVQEAYPKPQVQLCIVHQVRQALRYVSGK